MKLENSQTFPGSRGEVQHFNLEDYPEAKRQKMEDSHKRDLFREGISRLENTISGDEHNRKDMHDDLRFLNNDQWDSEVLAARTEAGRPCITANYLSTLVDSIVGEYRQNPPGLKIIPRGGEDDVEVANILQGLVRHIEQKGNGRTARTWALECAVKCGQGFYRVKTRYRNTESFDQEIIYEKILNPLSVFSDPDAVGADLGDMNFCFITQNMSRTKFKEIFPGHTPSSVSIGSASTALNSGGEEIIRVAEYWYKEYKNKTLVEMDNGSVMEKKLVPKGERKRIKKTRTIKAAQVKMAYMSGSEILGDPIEWPGKYIPIIRVYGKEDVVDDVIYRRGIVRNGKDSQRVYNYMRSSAVEHVSQSPRAPYIGTKEMFEGHEEEWDNSNIEPRQRLTYQRDPDGNVPKRETPPTIPSGMVNEAQSAVNDMHFTTGVFQAATGQKSNEVSGKALRARNREIANNAYAFLGNFNNALIHEGRVIVDLIRGVYDTFRIIQIVDEMDQPQEAAINVPDDTVTPGKGVDRVISDVTVGEYDVQVAVGPGYQTRREEGFDQILELTRHNPNILPMVMDVLAGMSDWYGADQLRLRFEKALPPDIKESEGIEAGPPPPPDPAVQAEQQKNQFELEKSKLEIQKLQLQVESSKKNG